MGKVEILTNHGVLVNESLEFWGDMDSYDENLKEFKDSLKDKIDNLEYYKNSNDLENYGILAHSTKSESKYLGFMKEAEIFLQHEQAGKEKNQAFIDLHFDELKKTINELDSLLESYFENQKKVILIADDSGIMLNFIEKIIGDEYQVIKANNGKEAIDTILKQEIYALLLDLNMPNINGFQVLDYLNDHHYFEKIPVVIVTGDDSEETIKRAFTYPILDVLNKPFKEENIKRVLVSIKSFYEHQ